MATNLIDFSATHLTWILKSLPRLIRTELWSEGSERARRLARGFAPGRRGCGATRDTMSGVPAASQPIILNITQTRRDATIATRRSRQPTTGEHAASGRTRVAAAASRIRPNGESPPRTPWYFNIPDSFVVVLPFSILRYCASWTSNLLDPP